MSLIRTPRGLRALSFASCLLLPLTAGADAPGAPVVPDYITAPDDRPATWDMTQEELLELGLGQTCADPVPMPGLPFQTAPTGPLEAKLGTIFINYDGEQINQGQENSKTNSSFMWGGNFSAYGDGAKRTATTQAVVEDWAAFNVIITESRPGSGDYTMNMTGPTNFIGGNVLGVAPVDCNDLSTHNNVTYAFHSVNDQFSSSTQATTIGQEVAHSYGLEHINQAADIMNPSNQGGNPAFLDNCYSVVGNLYCPDQHVASCGSQTQQNSFQELMNIFGPSTPDTEAPEVAITYPMNGEEFLAGASFDITATATDDLSVKEVRLYIDGEFVQTDTGEPYSWGVSNIPQGQYELHLIADDFAGNQAMSNVVVIGVGQAPTTSGTTSDGTTTAGTTTAGTTTAGTTTAGTTTAGTTSDGSSDSGPITTSDSDGLPPGFGDDGSEGGCACSAVPARGPAGLLLLTLGLVVRRRRR